MSEFSDLQLAAFHQLPGCSWTILRALVRADLFSVPMEQWSAEQLQPLGLHREQLDWIETHRNEINIQTTKEILQQNVITIIPIDHPHYPFLLKEISSPPAVLYVRGEIAALHVPALAVVGTRRPSAYGLQGVRHLVKPVAQQLCIISGLALGIDAAAHQAALDVAGPTVAVLGTGVDRIYPWENQSLANQILKHHGAIISEFPLGSAPERHHFPQRNRIIAGLAKATLLIEAGPRSGALITTKYALAENREVLAMPGSIFSERSIGVNNWLRLGAKAVTTPADILEVYQLTQGQLPAFVATSPRTETAAIILSLLTNEPIHIDELVEKSRLDTSVVSAALSLLEIDGLIRHHGGMFYSRPA